MHLPHFANSWAPARGDGVGWLEENTMVLEENEEEKKGEMHMKKMGKWGMKLGNEEILIIVVMIFFVNILIKTSIMIRHYWCWSDNNINSITDKSNSSHNRREDKTATWTVTKAEILSDPRKKKDNKDRKKNAYVVQNKRKETRRKRRRWWWRWWVCNLQQEPA